MIKALIDNDKTKPRELENLSVENARLRTECRDTAALLTRRELELAECKHQLKVMTALYEAICNSVIWRKTAPVRRFLDKVTKIAGKANPPPQILGPVGNGAGLLIAAGTERGGGMNPACGGGAPQATLPEKPLELLYVYKIASFGGVERVLLERAAVFKRRQADCRISVFFYEDEGAMVQIRDYVAQHDLGTHLRIVSRIDATRYDYVISIDTPEVLRAGIPPEKMLFECHTTYYNSQRYLASLPDSIRLVAVPSEAARLAIAERFPHLQAKLFVMRNFVPAHDAPIAAESKIWGKRPLLYLGRLDGHKNFTEVLDIFKYYRDAFADDLFLLLVGPVVGRIDLAAELARRNLADSTIALPPVGFDKVWGVYNQVKEHRGVFISASSAESFGLAAAEALSAGLPVLLSGIAPHIDLVAGSLAYVYPLGDVAAAAGKLRGVIENYDRAVADTAGFRQQFSEDNFLADWHDFIAMLQHLPATVTGSIQSV